MKIIDGDAAKNSSIYETSHCCIISEMPEEGLHHYLAVNALLRRDAFSDIYDCVTP